MKDKSALVITVISIVTGGIVGFLYWKFVGCSSGTCPIKSVWYFSTLWGMVAGYLVGDLIQGIIAYFKSRKNDKTV